MDCKGPDCKHESPFVVAVVHDDTTDLPVCDICLIAYIKRRDAGEQVRVAWLAI